MHNNNKFGYIPDGLYSLGYTTNATECALKSESVMFILPISSEGKFLELKGSCEGVPVLYNKITGNMSEKSLVLTQLTAIDKGLSFTRLPTHSLINKLIELIKAHNIQFIIFDNCEELINLKSEQSFKRILDLLEFEIKTLNIPVVLCGQASLKNLLEINDFFDNYRFNVFEEGLNISLNGQSLYFNVS